MYICNFYNIYCRDGNGEYRPGITIIYSHHDKKITRVGSPDIQWWVWIYSHTYTHTDISHPSGHLHIKAIHYANIKVYQSKYHYKNSSII
jgi:hypothetical protein